MQKTDQQKIIYHDLPDKFSRKTVIRINICANMLRHLMLFVRSSRMTELLQSGIELVLQTGHQKLIEQSF